MKTIDEKLNVRAEIEQAVAKECSFTEFNPVFEDLFFSLNWLEEQDGLKLEKYDIYQALMTAYSVGFNRGKKAHKPTKWLEIDYSFREIKAFLTKEKAQPLPTKKG